MPRRLIGSFSWCSSFDAEIAYLADCLFYHSIIADVVAVDVVVVAPVAWNYDGGSKIVVHNCVFNVWVFNAANKPLATKNFTHLCPKTSTNVFNTYNLNAFRTPSGQQLFAVRCDEQTCEHLCMYSTKQRKCAQRSLRNIMIIIIKTKVSAPTMANDRTELVRRWTQTHSVRTYGIPAIERTTRHSAKAVRTTNI